MLYIASHGLLYLMTAGLYLLIPFSHVISCSFASTNHLFVLSMHLVYFCVLLLNSTYKEIIQYFSSLIYVTYLMPLDLSMLLQIAGFQF